MAMNMRHHQIAMKTCHVQIVASAVLEAVNHIAANKRIEPTAKAAAHPERYVAWRD